MRIRSIEADNFKGFSSLQLDLEGKNAVIFGENGVGKSSVLEAINYLIWGVLFRLNNLQGTSYKSLNADLVRLGSKKLVLSMKLEFAGEEFDLEKSYEKALPGKGTSVKENKKHLDALVRSLSASPEDEKKPVPIFAYYGTDRSVLDIPQRVRQKHSFSKWTALERAAENALDFRTFFEWFREQDEIESKQIKERNDLSYRDPSLQQVKRAVAAMLDTVSDIKIELRPVRMCVVREGEEYRLDMLSDGEKCILTLFGDIARRLTLANPGVDDPLNGEGVVLIDELELHMHPSWQRKILTVLTQTFPNIQFIVTTHSPQILSEANESFRVFRLKKNGANDLYDTFGKSSGEILEAFMETGERPDVIQQIIDSVRSNMDKENYSAAETKLAELEKILSDSPEVTALRVALELALL